MSASHLINAHFFLSRRLFTPLFLVTSNNDVNAKTNCPSLSWQQFAPQMCPAWSSHSKYMCTWNENTCASDASHRDKWISVGLIMKPYNICVLRRCQDYFTDLCQMQWKGFHQTEWQTGDLVRVYPASRPMGAGSSPPATLNCTSGRGCMDGCINMGNKEGTHENIVFVCKLLQIIAYCFHNLKVFYMLRIYNITRTRFK